MLHVPMPIFAPVIVERLGQVSIQTCHKVLLLLLGIHFYQVGLKYCKYLQARYKIGEAHCKKDVYLGDVQSWVLKTMESTLYPGYI